MIITITIRYTPSTLTIIHAIIPIFTFIAGFKRWKRGADCNKVQYQNQNKKGQSHDILWQTTLIKESKITLDVFKTKLFYTILLYKMLFQVASMLKFGEYELSSGQVSDHYFDLREFMGQPKALRMVIQQLTPSSEPESELVCGVPYGAIPLATAYSMEYNVAQIMLRKTPKPYGTRNLIEGCGGPFSGFVTLIDDVWTTGQSMRKAQKQLEDANFIVERKIVILYRGEEEPPADLEYLYTEKEIMALPLTRFRRHLHQRGKTCFAADLPTMHEIVTLTRRLNETYSDLSVVKLHPELIEDWSEEGLLELMVLKESHDFLLWADIKICEVPHIALKQLEKYSWADIISIMSVVGEETLNKLQERAKEIEDKRKYPMMLVLVNSLHTEGRQLWTDDGDFNNINWINIVGSVGKRIPGLTYIRAGLHAETKTKETFCDLEVRGRSLIERF